MSGGHAFSADRSETETDAMCQALRDLMSEEIAEELVKEKDNVRISDIKKLMKTMNLTAEAVMQALELSDEEQAYYKALL